MEDKLLKFSWSFPFLKIFLRFTEFDRVNAISFQKVSVEASKKLG